MTEVDFKAAQLITRSYTIQSSCHEISVGNCMQCIIKVLGMKDVTDLLGVPIMKVFNDENYAHTLHHNAMHTPFTTPSTHPSQCHAHTLHHNIRQCTQDGIHMSEFAEAQDPSERCRRCGQAATLRTQGTQTVSAGAVQGVVWEYG